MCPALDRLEYTVWYGGAGLRDSGERVRRVRGRALSGRHGGDGALVGLARAVPAGAAAPAAAAGAALLPPALSTPAAGFLLSTCSGVQCLRMRVRVGGGGGAARRGRGGRGGVARAAAWRHHLADAARRAPHHAAHGAASAHADRLGCTECDVLLVERVLAGRRRGGAHRADAARAAAREGSLLRGHRCSVGSGPGQRGGELPVVARAAAGGAVAGRGARRLPRGAGRAAPRPRPRAGLPAGAAVDFAPRSLIVPAFHRLLSAPRIA